MKAIDYVLNNETTVLEFLKQHYPMYHLSNVFFRDIQYGIRTLLEKRGERIGYTEAENIARAFVEKLEREQILRPIDRQSWVLNYPAFKKPPVVQATPAKPAPGAAPAKSPAAAGARQPLPPLSSAKPAGQSAAPSTGAGAASPRPAGGLPPLKSARPAGGGQATAAATRPTDGQAPAQTEAATAAEQSQTGETAASAVEQAPASSQSAEEQPKQQGVPVAGASAQQQTPKRTLPPLKGNYKPAGKA